MIEANLISTTIPEKDSHSNVWWPAPSMKYVRPPRQNYDGVTIITDELCATPIVEQVNSPIKVGWLIEPPVIKPMSYSGVSSFEKSFSAIYTYSEELLNRNKIIGTEKYKLLRFGACWIPPQNCWMYEKKRLVSMIVSHKQWTEGHKLRYKLMELIREKNLPVDLYGTGTPRPFDDGIPGRLDPFKDYKYSIVIENCRLKDYFTDKIVDCFATGTIPIYWGATNISEIYERSGIVEFNNADEAIRILNNLKDIHVGKQAIHDNFRLVAKYASPDQNLAEAIKRDLGL